MIIQKHMIAPKLTKLKSFIQKSSIDIVQGVLLKDNCLAVTNFEIGVNTPIEITTDETFIIPPKAIELIENLPEGQIEIIPGENFSITIKAEHHIKNKFQSYDVNLFPKVELDILQTSNVIISSLDFEKSIKSVTYAVSNNTLKPIFSGVLFDSHDGYLNLVGCDTYRLAYNRVKFEKELKFVVPKASIQKLTSLGMVGNIEISYNNNHAIFKSEEYTVYTRLLEGIYISYEKTLTKNKNKTSINRTLFLEAIKRCMICVEEKNKGAVKLQVVDEKLTIAVNSEISEYVEVIKLEKPIEEPVTIVFNGSYLIDLLKSFDNENINLYIGSSVQPMVVDSDDEEQSAFVLPIRIN